MAPDRGKDECVEQLPAQNCSPDADQPAHWRGNSAAGDQVDEDRGADYCRVRGEVPVEAETSPNSSPRLHVGIFFDNGNVGAEGATPYTKRQKWQLDTHTIGRVLVVPSGSHRRRCSL